MNVHTVMAILIVVIFAPMLLVVEPTRGAAISIKIIRPARAEKTAPLTPIVGLGLAQDIGVVKILDTTTTFTRYKMLIMAFIAGAGFVIITPAIYNWLPYAGWWWEDLKDRSKKWLPEQN